MADRFVSWMRATILAVVAGILLAPVSAVLGPASTTSAWAITCPAPFIVVDNKSCGCRPGYSRVQRGIQPPTCAIICPAGQKPSPDGSTCVAAAPPKCTGGMVAQNGVCACPPGTTPGQRAGTCAAVCTGGSVIINGKCGCPAGTVETRPDGPAGPIQCGPARR